MSKLQDAIDQKSLDHERIRHNNVDSYTVNKIEPTIHNRESVILDKGEFNFVRILAKKFESCNGSIYGTGVTKSCASFYRSHSRTSWSPRNRPPPQPTATQGNNHKSKKK